MFCYIYLKLSIEVKYLLDSRIYFQNSDIIMQRNRENFCLEVANVINVFLSLGLLAYEIWLGDFYSDIINTIQTALATVYLAVWSYALY